MTAEPAAPETGEPRRTCLPRSWGLVIGGIGLVCQSPFLWDLASHGFPTYGKWLYFSIWCALMVLVDLLITALWMVFPRRPWAMLMLAILGLLVLSAAALPVALVLAGLIHGTLGEI